MSCQLHDLSHLIWVLCIDHVTGGGNPVVRQKNNNKVRTKCQMICWHFVRTFFVVICHFVRLNFLGMLSGLDLGFCSKHEIHFYYHHLPSQKRPNLAFLVNFGQALPAHLVPCWWVGWWLWRLGCVSHDIYLIYSYPF